MNEHEPFPRSRTSEPGRFDRIRGLVGLIGGPLTALVLLLLPLDLSTEAHRVAAVASLMVVFWMTEAIPLPATALLGISLFVIFGVAPASEILAAFGEQVIFLFIGSFMLAKAMQRHGLDRRIAYALLAHPWVGGSTYRTIWALGLTAWTLSMWISNTASVAMLFPVAMAIAGSTSEIMDEAPSEPLGDRYTTGLLLMLAYAGSIGGIATPIGTPPNLIGIALLQEGTGKRIGFLEWMAFGLPLAVVLLVVIFGIVLLLFRPTVRTVPGQTEMMRSRRDTLGPWTTGQRTSLLAFVVAVILWIAPGAASLVFGQEHAIATTLNDRLPEGVAALLAASLLFMLPADWRHREPVLPWEEAAAIDWGTVILFGGGIALGGVLFSTGLADRIGVGLVDAIGANTRSSLTALGVVVASVVSETSSNTASVNVVLPVILAATRATSAAPLEIGVTVTLAASMGFMLPVSTPPNAIVYGSGRVRLIDMIRAGILLDLAGVFTIWLAAQWFLPTVLELVMGGSQRAGTTPCHGPGPNLTVVLRGGPACRRCIGGDRGCLANRERSALP
jgi:sodium-dependent dicarboxylate transporter 2/3/5